LWHEEAHAREVDAIVDIYSTDTDSGQVSVIRKDGSGYRTVKEIAVGNAPRGGVKFTRDGRGFVSNTSTNTISELDALTHREVARIEVGHGPRGLAIVPGERYLLASNSGSNTVSVVDLESRTEKFQVAVGRDPRHMVVTPDGTAAYVCVWGSSYIAKLDLTGLMDSRPDTVREVGRVRIGDQKHPYSLNIDRSGMKAFVACNTGGEIPVIDLASDKVIARVTTRTDGCRAVAFTPDNQFALATLERDNSVAVVDLGTYKVTRYVPVGPAPRGIAVYDPDEVFYVSAFARDTVGVVPGIEVPTMAHSVTVVNFKDADLADPDSPISFEELPVGFGPCSVAIFDSSDVEIQEHSLESSLRILSGTEASKA
jgi:YVTN family beta-propeller protein